MIDYNQIAQLAMQTIQQQQAQKSAATQAAAQNAGQAQQAAAAQGAPQQPQGGNPRMINQSAPVDNSQHQAILDYLMGVGAKQGERDNIARQEAMIEQLRGGGDIPQMRGGGKYAAQPLEFVSSALAKGAEAWGRGRADEARTRYDTGLQADLNTLRARLYGGGGAPAPSYGSYRPMDTGDYGGGV